MLKLESTCLGKTSLRDLVTVMMLIIRNSLADTVCVKYCSVLPQCPSLLRGAISCRKKAQLRQK
jgi:hypothetical protein